MGAWFRNNFKTIVLISYLLPIIASIVVSLSHVIIWWEISNPFTWALYLSIAIEIAVLSSIAGSRISNLVWLPFSIVTLIQVLGNIFYHYHHIDIDGELFLSWVELMSPLLEYMSIIKEGNLVGHKRLLAVFAGLVIPGISISFFHLFIKESKFKEIEKTIDEPEEKKDIPNQEKEVEGVSIDNMNGSGGIVEESESVNDIYEMFENSKGLSGSTHTVEVEGKKKS